MSDEIVWRSPSMEGKWRNGRGILHLRMLEYYNRRWIDFRLMNMEKEPPTFTRHGIRLTLEQAEEMLPVLRQLIEQMKDKEEEDDRKESSERDTR